VVIPVLVAAAPPFVPWPAVFGLLATLQNVATISSWQITPVLVSGEVTVWPPVPSGCCCWLAIVACCAATGDVAKSSAMMNASFIPNLAMMAASRPPRCMPFIPKSKCLCPQMFQYDENLT
jgi:hypothetical protein